MNLGIKTGLYFFLGLLSLNCLAYDPATMETVTPFPQQMLTNHASLALYKITNQSHGNLVFDESHYLQPNNYTTDLQLLSGTETSSGLPFCTQAQTLADGQSCILGLELNPISELTHITGKTKEQYSPIYTLFKPIDIKTFDTPTSDMPTLSMEPTPIHLVPGTPQYITVTNNSADIAANYVQFQVPTEIQNKIDTGIGSCSYIKPGENCKLLVKAKQDATPNANLVAISAQGSNTHAVTNQVNFLPELAANNIVFTKPETQNLTIHNQSATAVNVQSLDFIGTGSNKLPQPTTAHNITFGSLASCQPIAPGGSCNVAVTANNNSYGEGPLQINYQAFGLTKKIQTDVTVAKTSAVFTQEDGSALPNNEFRVDIHSSAQTFRLKNSGSFNIQAPDIDWADQALPGISIINNNCTTQVAVGSSCSFQLQASSNAKLNQTANIRATGTNIDSIENNAITLGLTITHETAATYQHLSYIAFKISNSTKYDVILSNLTSTLGSGLNSNLIHYCAPNDTSCVYKTETNCDTSYGDKTLHNHNSCYLWFKALKPTTQPIGKISGNVTIAAEAEWIDPTTGKILRGLPIDSVTLPLNYELDLYAGGMFTTANNQKNHIIKWDGTSLHTLAGDTNGEIESLGSDGVDLYAGGYFSSAGGNNAQYIARWNNATWSPLISNSTNGADSNVFTLAGDGNGTLYLGGSFTSLGNTTINHIATWNNVRSTWKSLDSSSDNGTDGPVLSMFLNGPTLTIGGNFTKVGDLTDATNIAQLNLNNATWSKLGDGLGGTGDYVAALNEYNNDVIASGNFLYSGASVGLGNIGAWTTTNTWQPLPDQIPNGIGGNVHALTTCNNKLYVGGTINMVYNLNSQPSVANNLVSWDGSIWSTTDTKIQGTAANVSALASTNNVLYVGGVFSQVGTTVNAANLAAFDTKDSTWQALGFTTLYTSGTVYALYIAPALTSN